MIRRFETDEEAEAWTRFVSAAVTKFEYTGLEVAEWAARLADAMLDEYLKRSAKP